MLPEYMKVPQKHLFVLKWLGTQVRMQINFYSDLIFLKYIHTGAQNLRPGPCHKVMCRGSHCLSQLFSISPHPTGRAMGHSGVSGGKISNMIKAELPLKLSRAKPRVLRHYSSYFGTKLYQNFVRRYGPTLRKKVIQVLEST